MDKNRIVRAIDELQRIMQEKIDLGKWLTKELFIFETTLIL